MGRATEKAKPRRFSFFPRVHSSATPNSFLCIDAANMGIWVRMKTTIELPEALFRRAKSMAAHEGVTLKQLLTEALESQLDDRRSLHNENSAAPRWMRAYGALRHLRRERKAIERAIEAEFEKVEPEDRL